MNFKDHFSRQASEYAKFRPHYPRELFQLIAEQAPNDELALDCATGNGQAALGLAEFFREVIAIDASEKQIVHARPNDHVEYRVAPAEATGLADSSFDAVTVAQALHWLELVSFYAEVKRILKPGGILAVWAYDYLRISPAVDAIVSRFHDEIVGPFWPTERQLVGFSYRDLPFPFKETQVSEVLMKTSWTLAHLLGYLRTWSATQRYLAANEHDPVKLIEEELAATWGKPEEREGLWPLTVRVGRV